MIGHFFRIALYGGATAYVVNSGLETFSPDNITAILLQQEDWTTLAPAAVALLGLVAIVSELFSLWKYSKLPPGTHGFPLLGEIPIFLIRFKGNVGAFFHHRQQTFGNVFLSAFPLNKVVTLADDAGLTWLWNNDRKLITEPSWPPTIQKLLGRSSFANAKGLHHKTLRRLLEPFFTPLFVKNYLNAIDTTTKKEANKWCDSFQPSSVFKLYALRLFFNTAFGEIEESLILQLHDDYGIWFKGMFSPFGDLRIPGWSFDSAMKARERILNTFDTLIDRFAANYPPDSDRSKTTIMGRVIHAKDETGKGLTREEMKDILLNLIFAGHDTTFFSISTLLYHLSRHPAAKRALIDEVAALNDDPLDHDQLKNAPVLNAVIMESWRTDPPVLMSWRKSSKELHYKGYSFPKGTVFSYNALLAAQNESIYKNGTEFHFERFLPKDHPLAKESTVGDSPINAPPARYPVFGGSTHMCLGQHFARLELRVIFARLFKDYDVTIRNGTPLPFPANGWGVDFRLTPKKK